MESTRRRFSPRGAIAFRLRPPDSKLFSLIRRAGDNAALAGELACRLLERWPEDQGLRDEITRLEHEGDRLTHKVINELRRSKLAPFDKEDIYALAGAIDDVVDDIEEVSENLALREIEAPTEQSQQLAGVIRDSTRALSRALQGLESLENVEEHLDEVRSLEQEGDRIYRDSLAALFRGSIDPMFVLRWKDIYDALEEAIDRCRSASNWIESIVVKHS